MKSSGATECPVSLHRAPLKCANRSPSKTKDAGGSWSSPPAAQRRLWEIGLWGPILRLAPQGCNPGHTPTTVNWRVSDSCQAPERVKDPHCSAAARATATCQVAMAR